ncbi:MAG TPA: hypothetical protein PLV92_06350 [Pirellulaceae bacterium]|nr:hypothetical protein [Pirellulaceae bacterium]
MSQPLLAPNFLFRFSAPLRYAAGAGATSGAAPVASSAPVASGTASLSPGVAVAAKLGEEYRLPNFSALEGKTSYADVRGAWSEAGLSFSLRVAGKSQPLWCRDSRLDDSDGFQLWIDTRDTHNVHRASRFCHRFLFLPAGTGRRLEEPMAAILGINRARESPRPPPDGSLRVNVRRTAGAYSLEIAIGASALTGFDSTDHPRLGFTYLVIDRELGQQTFAYSPEFTTLAEDPSLWATLEMVRE